MLYPERSNRDVLRGIFYRGCSTQKVLQWMFYGGFSTGDVLHRRFYRGCSTQNVLRGMFYRGFSAGDVLCSATPRTKCLLKLGLTYLEFVTDEDILTTCGYMNDICPLCRRYRKRVMFYVRHPSDVVMMYVRNEKGMRRKISGFPQTMKWNVELVTSRLCSQF
jgi:hypothetical protein